MLKYMITVFIIFVLIFFSLKNNQFNGKSLKFGLSMPKTGIMHAVGDAAYSGANAYFLHANDNNLLGDVKIELIVYDDKYESAPTLENVKKILPDIINSEIPFIAPLTEASFLRDKNGVNIVNFRSSYKEEVDYIVEYLRNRRDITKYAVFYQNDDYGEEGFVSLFCNISFKDADEMIKELDYNTQNLLFSQVAPSYMDNSKPVILEYKKLMQMYYPQQPLSFRYLQ